MFVHLSHCSIYAFQAPGARATYSSTNTDTENEREDCNEGTRNGAINLLKGTRTHNLDNEVIEMYTI